MTASDPSYEKDVDAGILLFNDLHRRIAGQDLNCSIYIERNKRYVFQKLASGHTVVFDIQTHTIADMYITSTKPNSSLLKWLEIKKRKKTAVTLLQSYESGLEIWKTGFGYFLLTIARHQYKADIQDMAQHFNKKQKEQSEKETA
jgi:hypothetical protein